MAADGSCYQGTPLLDSMAKDDGLQVIMTRDGEVYSSGKDMESVALSRYESDGCSVGYSLGSQSNDLISTNVTMPVFYAEEEIVSTQYALNSASGSNISSVNASGNVNTSRISNGGFVFSLYNKNNQINDGDRGYIVVRCDVSSAETYPYECSLEVDGKTYTPATRDSYFDNETGEVTRMYMMFYGLTEEDILGDAHMNVTSIMKKYMATKYVLS